MGKTTGTAFVDVSVPDQAVYLGDLPSHQWDRAFSTWRDIKVYRDHALIISEKAGHGLQVSDLTRLRGVTEPRMWTEDAHYAGFGNAHNVAINEEAIAGVRWRRSARHLDGEGRAMNASSVLDLQSSR